jgi:hypothetical protein
MSRYFTVRYGVHGVYGENYAVQTQTVRCKSQDSVFLPLTVRCDTVRCDIVRYSNSLQYYDTIYTTGYTASRLLLQSLVGME